MAEWDGSAAGLHFRLLAAEAVISGLLALLSEDPENLKKLHVFKAGYLRSIAAMKMPGTDTADAMQGVYHEAVANLFKHLPPLQKLN